MNETVGIRLPDGQEMTRYMPVKYTEDDIDIALRTAKSFPTGSILTVDGVKFRVLAQDPPKVEEVKAKTKIKAPVVKVPEPEEVDDEEPKSGKKLSVVPVEIGQRWVTKDPRRKQEPFEVVKVEGDAVITDKGAKIGIHRLNRYKLVS